MSTNILSVAGDSLQWQVGDKFLKLSQFKLKDFKEYQAWVRDSRIKQELKDLKDAGIDTPEYKFQTVRSMPKGSDLTSLMFSEMSTMGGMVYALYMSIKKEHSDITLEFIEDNFTFNSNKELLALVDFITLGKIAKEESKGGSKNVKKA